MEYQPLFNMKFNVRHLPLIIPTTLLILVVITSFLAFHYEHVSVIVPYISDTGTLPPESCFFGQILNIIWILISFAMYCKYRQVKDILQKHNMSHKDALNKYTFLLGLAAGFGISIVANFQETNSFVIHWVGAVLCFGCGSVYLSMQTMIYIAITPVIGQIVLTKLRIVLSALGVISFIVFFTSAMISYSLFTGESVLHWKVEEGGYVFHQISTVTEWTCAISLMVYITLFGEEFKNFVIYEPAIDTGLVKQTNTAKRDSKIAGRFRKVKEKCRKE